jgi:hypothetical protein
MGRWKLFKRSVLCLSLIGALGGCAALNPSYQPAASGCRIEPCFKDPGGVPGLLRYADYLHTLDADARQREYARTEELFARDATTVHRLRLVLLLSLPDATFRSDTRARELLYQYLQGNDDDLAYHDFAGFLFRSLNERHAAEQAIEAERQQLQVLRKQVEELKAIEQRINQRDRAKGQEGKP